MLDKKKLYFRVLFNAQPYLPCMRTNLLIPALLLIMPLLEKTQLFAQSGWHQMGKTGEWSNTVMLRNMNGVFYSLESDGTMYATTVNGSSSTFQRINNPGTYAGTTLFAVKDGLIYYVQDGTMYTTDSRGGSWQVHERLRTGDRLQVSAPRSLFCLAPDAPEHVFIAGGIGITPILSMIEACQAAGQRWRLLYCVRSRARAAYLWRLAAHHAHVQLHVDEEQEALPDVAGFLRALPRTAHVYCCGPTPLMDAVGREAATPDVPGTGIAQIACETRRRRAVFADRSQARAAPGRRRRARRVDRALRLGWGRSARCFSGGCADRAHLAARSEPRHDARAPAQPARERDRGRLRHAVTGPAEPGRTPPGDGACS